MLTPDLWESSLFLVNELRQASRNIPSRVFAQEVGSDLMFRSVKSYGDETGALDVARNIAARNDRGGMVDVMRHGSRFFAVVLYQDMEVQS